MENGDKLGKLGVTDQTRTNFPVVEDKKKRTNIVIN